LVTLRYWFPNLHKHVSVAGRVERYCGTKCVQDINEKEKSEEWIDNTFYK